MVFLHAHVHMCVCVAGGGGGGGGGKSDDKEIKGILFITGVGGGS